MVPLKKVCASGGAAIGVATLVIGSVGPVVTASILINWKHPLLLSFQNLRIYMYIYIYTFVYNVNIIMDRYSLKAAQDSKFMFPNLTSLYWPLIRTLWSQGAIWPKSSVLYLSSLRSCIRILMSLGKVVVK